MGFFERAGLTVEVTVMANGAAVGSARSPGTLDVGASSSVRLHERTPARPYTLIAPGALLPIHRRYDWPWSLPRLPFGCPRAAGEDRREGDDSSGNLDQLPSGPGSIRTV